MKRIFLSLFLFASTTTFAKPQPPENILKFDFPDVEVGVAENPEGPTGLTLFYFPQGARAAVDIRGGSVGTFFTQEKMQQGEAYIDGVAFAGGGILGMESIAGAVSSLYAKENKTNFAKMPLISGAVIFDFTPRTTRTYPDKALGQKAFDALKKGEFPQGRHGVGISATSGKLFGDSFTPAGQGGAFAQVGKTKIAVFTVINSVGVILDAKGEVLHGSKLSKEALLAKSDQLLQQPQQPFNPSANNTTLTLVVINEKLGPRHLQQIGRQVHHALSHVIYPYATILDGDVLYIVSTGTQESDLFAPSEHIEADLNAKRFYLGLKAGELAKQAVWNAVK